MRRTVILLIVAAVILALVAWESSRHAQPYDAQNDRHRDYLAGLCSEVYALDALLMKPTFATATKEQQWQKRRATKVRQYNTAMARMQRVWQGGTYGLPERIRKPFTECGGR